MAKAKLENVVRRLEDMGYKIHTEKVTKNGVELTAVTNMCGEVCPICYFEDITEDNVSDEVAAERIRNMFESAMRGNPLAFVNFKAYMESLTPDCLEARICAKDNAGKGVITVPFLNDLEIYPVIVFEFGKEKASVRVTEEVVNNVPWLFPLFESGCICITAMKNSFKKTKKIDYTDVLIRTLGHACADGRIDKDQLDYIINDVLSSGVNEAFGVLTNDEMYGGAIAIADTDVLKEYAKEIDDDFYILPSSIHEIICVKAGYVGDNIKELKDMVLNVNADVLDPLDKLTDSVYFFSRDTNLVTKVM